MEHEAGLPGATAVARQELLGATPKYTLFESGHVRPMALSPDGERLFVVNTPDASLEIFEVTSTGLIHARSVPVGLEPVAVAARTKNEVWVVNHLSDSVSIVSLEAGKARVKRTLLVGDEPRDIVFAGEGRARAFITTAHRGQNSPVDPQLTAPGVGRADVWVFDSSALGTTLGGTPLTILTFFADTPRALAATSDGSRVYVAAFNSGNKTASIHRDIVPDVGGRPPPNVNHELDPERNVSMIVKHNGSNWVDSLGAPADSMVAFNLPDKDVFAIDALATPPQPATGQGSIYTGVGTTLFNMAVNPVSGKVYVSNTEARNDKRFEGEGIFSLGETLRGHLVESRITVLDATGGVAPRHLNKHINYASCCAPNPSSENARSMALPLEMAVSSNGATLYVAAL
jgi:DNA-binding beta-propeller fold protein YncE